MSILHGWSRFARDPMIIFIYLSRPCTPSYPFLNLILYAWMRGYGVVLQFCFLPGISWDDNGTLPKRCPFHVILKFIKMMAEKFSWLVAPIREFICIINPNSSGPRLSLNCLCMWDGLNPVFMKMHMFIMPPCSFYLGSLIYMHMKIKTRPKSWFQVCNTSKANLIWMNS